MVGEAPKQTPQAESQAEGPGSENQGSDAEGAQPAPEELTLNTSTPESNAQALTDLQADLAGKDAQIAALTKTATETVPNSRLLAKRMPDLRRTCAML